MTEGAASLPRVDDFGAGSWEGRGGQLTLRSTCMRATATTYTCCVRCLAHTGEQNE